MSLSLKVASVIIFAVVVIFTLWLARRKRRPANIVLGATPPPPVAIPPRIIASLSGSGTTLIMIVGLVTIMIVTILAVIFLPNDAVERLAPVLGIGALILLGSFLAVAAFGGIVWKLVPKGKHKNFHAGESALRQGGASTEKPAEKAADPKPSFIWKFTKWIGASALFLVVCYAGWHWVYPMMQPKPLYPPEFHAGLFCSDGDQRREFHRESSGIKFRETFPAGCWSLVIMPNQARKGTWHTYPVDQKNCPGAQAYIMSPIDHKIAGPIDWCNDSGPFLRQEFLVQALKPGQAIEFVTDDLNVDISKEPATAGQLEKHVYEWDGPGIVEAKTIKREAIPETEEARQARFEGIVRVYVIVDENGDPHDVQLDNPPGLGMNDQIINAVSYSKFKPATKDGVPITVHELVNIKFPY